MSEAEHSTGGGGGGGGARLRGRVAVVTGASSGNGRAIATTLAREGATVICTDLQPEPLAAGYETDGLATDKAIRRDGGNAVFERVDVQSEEDLQAAVRRAADEFGRLDIWVNNAGIGIGLGPLETLSRDDLELTLRINLIGTWLGCKAAVTQMKQQELRGRCRGRIVNMGSIAADGGQPGLSIYTTAKGAVHALTRQLAVECAPAGINVNAVAPGYIPTAMTREFWDDPAAREQLEAMHPWFELASGAQDVAGAVAFLASDDAAFITGIVVPIDGGVLAG